MKRTIHVVIAAAMALMVVAALSAASASADTVLCSSYETPCALNNIEEAGSYVLTGDTEGFPSLTIEASGTTEFECSLNILEAESKAAIGNPLPAAFYSTLGGCHKGAGGIACTGSTNSPTTTLEASTSGGYMKIGSAANPLAFTFECGVGLPGAYSCTYSTTGTLSLKVDEEEVKALAVPMVRTSGSACYTGSPRLWVRNNIVEGSFISKYTATGSVICKTADEPCDEANRYGSGTSLSASPETKATFKNPIYTTECTSSSLSGQLTGSGGVGQNVPVEINSAAFTGCSNNTTVTVESLPWKGTISHGAAAGEGSLYMTGVKLKFVRLGLTCYYGGNVSAKIQTNSKVVFSASSLQVLSGSSGLCGSLGTGSGSLSATYGLTAPSPFYVTWI